MIESRPSEGGRPVGVPRSLLSRGLFALFLLRAAVRPWGIVSTARRTTRTLRSGGILAVVSKLRSLSIMERNIVLGTVPPPRNLAPFKNISAGAISPTASGFRLDQDFGMDCERWEKFLLQNEQTLPEERASRVWVLLTGEPGSSKVTETCRSVSEAGLVVRAIDVAGRTFSLS